MREFEVRWESELPAAPAQVWDAITVHTAGWLWKVEYEPRVGGAERGLSQDGGTVVAWDPERHFATRSPDGDGFNRLDYRLEARGEATRVSYRHQGVLPEEDFDRQEDCCRQHTEFYRHTLTEYVRGFAGREPVYVSADGPESSTAGGFTAVRPALGLPENAAPGDRVRLAPAGLAPIEGVVDYRTASFLGVRSPDALYRFYGRDTWGWPVGLAHHLFAPDADATTAAQSWSAWLNAVFTTEKVSP